MPDEEVFDSIEAVRAHYYPESAPLLEVKSNELLEFPRRLSEESLKMIQRIAAAAVGRSRSQAGGEEGVPQPSRKGAGMSRLERRDVVPSKSGKGWDVTKPGRKTQVSRHTTQLNAEKAAKRQLGQRGGEVVIHGRDGKIRDKDTVSPAHDPNPPKDRRH
jgi:hypothetical protein